MSKVSVYLECEHSYAQTILFNASVAKVEEETDETFRVMISLNGVDGSRPHATSRMQRSGIKEGSAPLSVTIPVSVPFESVTRTASCLFAAMYAAASEAGECSCKATTGAGFNAETLCSSVDIVERSGDVI